ncbi:MAG: hypothetical protein M4579_004235 [Chaenotheca gracillima]|nr:MAG: hypothetical protein M4579_004235 [Chaenotheca gracillima]
MASSLQSSLVRGSPLRCCSLRLTTSSATSYAATPSITTSLTTTRHASLIRRPLRPYTFTQLITLSDGSTIVQRTTSPLPHYKSTKDTRNHALWNPSSEKLANVEEDEAGRLRAFRQRFGRGWDAEAAATGGDEGEDTVDGEEEGDLMDLISGAHDNASGNGDNEKGGKGKE